jgi:hypothetical protein
MPPTTSDASVQPAGWSTYSPPTPGGELPTGTAAAWSPVARAAFRFVCALAVLHLALYLLPTLLQSFPVVAPLGELWSEKVVGTLWQPRIAALARALGIVPAPYDDSAPALPVTVLVGVAVMVTLAATAALVWTAVDRRRTAYPRAWAWLHVYLRYALGIVLLHYGMRKLFLDQFGPAPTPARLLQPVGTLNLGEMLAVFMSASPMYQIFTGAVEVLTAVLLIVRRTARLGALLAVAVTTQIVVLNYAYHFTMYVLSVALLAMALVLALPEFLRLARLLVLEQAVPAPPRQPLFADRRADRVAGAIGLLVLGTATFGDLRPSGRIRAVPGPLDGAYVVEEMVRGGVAVPPLLTDSALWRGLVLAPPASADGPARATVAFARDTLSLATVIDTAARTLTFRTRRPQGPTSRWTYAAPDAAHLVLTGTGDLHRLMAGARGARGGAGGGVRQIGSVSGAAPVVPGAVSSTSPKAGPAEVRIVLRRIEPRSLALLRAAPWFR